MPFSNYGLDHLVAQEMSKVTECRAADVVSSFPQSEHWVSDFVLNSFFRFPLPPEATRFGFAFLRRAEAAFIEYEQARGALSKYVEASSRKPSIYFRALHHFEMTIAMLYQSYNFTRQLTSKDFFRMGDGSPYESLHHIYNSSRYFNVDLPYENLHAVWITNAGVTTSDYSLPFEHLTEFLEEVGQMANKKASGSLSSA